MGTSPKQVYGSRFSRWLGTRFFVQPDGRVTADVIFKPDTEGAPGYLHGGIAASLLDEAMGGAVWATGLQAMSVNLTCDYRHPVMVSGTAQVVGWIERIEGRKAFTTGKLILPDGTTAVEATGIYVQVPPEMLPKGLEFGTLGDRDDGTK